MPSAARLAAGLEERRTAGAEAAARAGTAAEYLLAQVASLRSLAVLAGRVDQEGTDMIVKRAAEQVADAAGEVQALIERHIAGLKEAKKRER